MDSVLQDLRYALRMLVKSPGITAITFLTVGVSTGANATVFGFVSALLLRPAPGVAEPQSVVAIYTSDYSSGPFGTTSYPDFLTLKADATAFARLAAMQNDSTVVRMPDKVERLPVGAVTGEFFELLGVRAALGRTIGEADTRADAPLAAAIGYQLWKRSFASDPAVLGKVLVVNGRPYTVVGVTADGFTGLDLGSAVDVWTPLVAPPLTPEERGNRGLAVVGRLRKGATLQEAQAQVTSIANTLGRTFPVTNLGTLQAPSLPRPMIALRHSRMPPEVRPMVATFGAILVAAVALVLVIACANVAGLLVSRAAARDREMVVRLALGAGRRRLVRQLLTESLLLGLGGGLCGLLVALWTSDVLPSFFPEEQASLLDTSVDIRVVVFTTLLSIGSSILFGLAPALHAAGSATADSLRGTSTRSSDGHRAGNVRRILVTAQVAAAVVLLVCSALLVKSLVNAVVADLGFGTREGVVATAEMPADEPPAKGAIYFADALDRIRRLPGVEAAALAGTLPLNRGSRRGFRVEGYQVKPGEGMEFVVNVVSDDYFETMRIHLRAGRTFDSMDRAGGQRVVIINDVLANRFFAGNAVGRQILDSRGRRLTIMGVVQAHKYLSVQDPPVAMVYYPFWQEYQPRMSLVARVSGSPLAMIEPIRRELTSGNEQVAIYRTIRLSAHLAEAIAAERLTASLVAVCGAMALLLATIGVYGVVAYAVVRRTREIGIRVALGAQPYDVVRLILRDGLGVTLVGLAVGLVAAALAARTLGSLTLLYGVNAWDPQTYLVVPMILIAVALLAVGPPARRALRMDPNVVLRHS